MKPAARPHWHVDFLRQACRVEAVWYVVRKRLECVWARRLCRAGVTLPVPKFGSSDCDCPGHLFQVNSQMVYPNQ